MAMVILKPANQTTGRVAPYSNACEELGFLKIASFASDTRCSFYIESVADFASI